MRTMVSERECVDLQGRAINPGYHYVPGPGACTFCICTDGMPKFCKPVLCSPPTNCKSFRVGLSCCEFICLDDEMKEDTLQEMSLRYVASAIAFILVVSVGMFLIFRMRRRKMRQRAMRSDDRRSLASIGYIGGGMGYEREDGQVGFPGLKPNYVPRGEAPPPYDEAVAQARVDQMRMTPEQRSAIVAQSIAIESTMRAEEPPRPSSVHIYSNTPRSNAIAAAQAASNHAYIFNAPLLAPPSQSCSDTRELHSLPLLPPAAVTFPTGSLGTVTNRGLIDMINRGGNYSSPHVAHQSSSLHRTIPRFSTAADNHIFDPNVDPHFVRASRLQYLEMRRSFHRPNENRSTLIENNSNSIPGNLDLTSRNIERDRRACASETAPEASSSNFTLQQFNQNFVDDAARRQKGTILHLMGLFNEMLPEQHRVQMPDLPTAATVDKPSCMCYTSPPGDEGDADEYHSECENCKSANSSRWVLEDDYGAEEEEGTQTLQRRAPPSIAPPPATATLPQPLTKQRSNPGLSSNWDNWFTVMQDSSSSDED